MTGTISKVFSVGVYRYICIVNDLDTLNKIVRVSVAGENNTITVCV